MPKAIIIEDEQQAANLLEAMLSEIDSSVQVVEKCQDLPAGVKSVKKHSPDIVFLDIELPVYSGIQLLDFFNPEEINFHIIFTTASNDYAVRAFEMSAVDYLMKPLQSEKLKAALEKVSRKQLISGLESLPLLKQNFQPDGNRKIVVPVASGFEILNLKDICYFKAEGSYTQIYFNDGNPLIVSKNLKHFEFILAGMNSFVRIHRSFIANISFAKKIFRKDGGILVLENNTELPVAEDKMQMILEALAKL
jgi:two-component system LytT family response regulator